MLCALLRHSFVIDPTSFVLQQWQERFYKRVEAERSLARWCSGQHPLRPKETRRAENTSSENTSAKMRNLFCFADLFFLQLHHLVSGDAVKRGCWVGHAPRGLYLVNRIAAFAKLCVHAYVYFTAQRFSNCHSRAPRNPQEHS